MKKDIEWLNNEVEKRIKKIKTDEVSFVGSDYFDEGYINGMRDVQAIANQLDEPEVLSQEWIDKFTSPADDEGRLYVWIDDLENLIVPKREKPVIPEYVAEYIEVGKDNAHDLEQVLTNVLHYEGESCAYEYTCEHHIWARNNLEDFTLAFMFGYEIEKEPKFYAMVKGGDLLSDEKYWNYWIENESLEIGDNKVHPDVIAEYMLKTTKEEWNKLGINDTNADFEEADADG